MKRTIGLVTGALMLGAAVFGGAGGARAATNGDVIAVHVSAKKFKKQDVFTLDALGGARRKITKTKTESNPFFNSDGTKLLTQSRRDGNTEIYVMDSDGSNPVNLTNNPAVDAVPKFSADDSKIAFQSLRDEPNSEIYTMNADGTGVQRLTNIASIEAQPAFSPDGSRIVFISTRDSGTGFGFDLYSMDADDGANVVRLTTTAASETSPSFSPSGDKILFTREGDIFTMDPDGTDEVNLTSDLSAGTGTPSYSPDGTKIVFSQNIGVKPFTTDLWVMNADGSGRLQLTNTKKKYEDAASWAPAP